MVKYKVSVILPVYNGEKTLATTLESLVNQTFKDFELVCCIDGTNDESENIINLFRDKFNKLTILKNQLNRGLGATMNRLMSNTNGEYIAIAELPIGTTLRTVEGTAILESKENIGNMEVVKIEVDDAHTYVLEEVLSHNIKYYINGSRPSRKVISCWLTCFNPNNSAVRCPMTPRAHCYYTTINSSICT